MAVSNDPFEEFEFRPINDGLGFHHKQKAAPSTTPTVKTTTTTTTTSSRSASDSFTAPLPRSEIRHEFRPETSARASLNIPSIEDDSIAKAQTAVNEILKNLNQKRQFDFVHETEKQKNILKKSKPYFFAATLDAMLITAAFLLSMIVMLTITKVDLFLNLNHEQTSGFVYVATVGLFLSITFMYMVVNRAFIGCTPGEWAFDQQCGSDEQMNSLTYVPRLALRTLIVIVESINKFIDGIFCEFL